jgi:NAD(P)-dependent dehydrogenase (short-subunit alcohol dehydrogenase family)
MDLSGQRIVITGASGGLGEESARALASKGASVTMAARSAEKNAAAAERIRATVPDADLELRELDLASLASVRSFAKDFLADHDRIDVLLNNAGVMACPHGTTADGFEMQLGTNHLGHFLLTGLLDSALGKGSRVVELSSGAHGMADVDYDDPMFERREYHPWISYGQSKTANALFALELDRRLRARGASAYSVHPGMIMTELSRHFTEETMTQMLEMRAKRAEEHGGAAEEAPELADQGGRYLADCQIGEVGGDIARTGVAEWATDVDSAARLWTLSEELVGESLFA